MKQKSFEQIGQSKDIMDLNWTGIPVAQLSAYPIPFNQSASAFGNGIVWMCVCAVRCSALLWKVDCVRSAFYDVLFKLELLCVFLFSLSLCFFSWSTPRHLFGQLDLDYVPFDAIERRGRESGSVCSVQRWNISERQLCVGSRHAFWHRVDSIYG